MNKKIYIYIFDNPFYLDVCHNTEENILVELLLVFHSNFKDTIS